MTNKEKAVCMSLQVRDLCVEKGVTRDNAETASLLVQQAALQMAEWKDIQFKEEKKQLIEKACKEHCNCCGYAYMACRRYNYDNLHCRHYIKFKQTMEEEIKMKVEIDDTATELDRMRWKITAEKVSCNIYKKIIEHYGTRNQLKKLSEEVYELQEAVIDLQCFTTCGNADTNRNQHVVEEIADVFVILRQLVMHFEIDQYEIEKVADYKVKRTLERIKKEVENV